MQEARILTRNLGGRFVCWRGCIEMLSHCRSSG